MFANNNWYLLLRLYYILCDRLCYFHSHTDSAVQAAAAELSKTDTVETAYALCLKTPSEYTPAIVVVVVVVVAASSRRRVVVKTACLCVSVVLLTGSTFCVVLILLLTGRKSEFSPYVMTSCTDSREIWHSQRAHGSAWPCKISCQSVHGGGNVAPKMAKISTFW